MVLLQRRRYSLADLITRALDMQVEQALGRVHEAEAKFDEMMVRVTDLQRDLHEFRVRIDAEQVRLAGFIAKNAGKG